MEVDEIQIGSKFARKSCNSNGNEHGRGGGGATVDFTAGVGGVGQLCGWPSSRIVRVSRASGGKDRHSKVLTSKGLRDRRVRLSVNTAIQFYDLQDRLGYDQPSKAVDWLLKVAANSISELPPISTPFPDTPKQLNDENNMSGVGVTGLGLDSPDVETLSKSACSSNSENSKGSGGGLSLSRSESRLKARERARERASKEKDNDKEQHHQHQHQHHQSATFTELLSSGYNGTNNVVNQHSNNNNSPNGEGTNFFPKSQNNWPTMAMDYFGGTGVLVPSTTTRPTHGFSGQIQLGNTMPQAIPTHGSSPFFTISGDSHQELHSFSLIPEHYVQNNEYNLNFSISSTSSSGLAGFNRGTLQSNSSTPSLLPQIQRFSPTDNNGSSPSPFFLTPPPHAAVSVVGSHHQQHHFQPTGFDAGLQLFYGDGGRHGDQKGKGKG